MNCTKSSLWSLTPSSEVGEMERWREACLASRSRSFASPWVWFTLCSSSLADRKCWISTPTAEVESTMKFLLLLTSKWLKLPRLLTVDLLELRNLILRWFDGGGVWSLGVFCTTGGSGQPAIPALGVMKPLLRRYLIKQKGNKFVSARVKLRDLRFRLNLPLWVGRTTGYGFDNGNVLKEMAHKPD